MTDAELDELLTLRAKNRRLRDAMRQAVQRLQGSPHKTRQVDALVILAGALEGDKP